MRIRRVSVLPDWSFRLGMVPRSIPSIAQKGDKKQRGGPVVEGTGAEAY
jgi:hypothetical protein